MKQTYSFEAEYTRHGITPGTFLAYVRKRVDAKDGRLVRSDLDLDYFVRGDDLNFDIHHDDGVHEKSVSRPYQMQTYIKYPDGMVYNEICEFEFDSNGRTGTGYYYLLNVCEEEIEEPSEFIEAVSDAVEQTKTRSAWERGVKAYAVELCEQLSEAVYGGYVDMDDLSNRRLMEKAMLNGASDWSQYSWGGCALCYDGDIARRLCAPWELRKTDNGRREPNKTETWIDVQTRALYQACSLVLRCAF